MRFLWYFGRGGPLLIGRIVWNRFFLLQKTKHELAAFLNITIIGTSGQTQESDVSEDDPGPQC